jgi:hypothetical protein
MRNMKKIGIHWIGILLLWVGASTMQAQAQGYGRVSFQQFYDHLSPYGDWVNDPDYGYIWLPAAGPDFRPYMTNGHWVSTAYGNTWVSNYDWGWAPFHYGRWFHDDYYGWAWVPGYEWGPAWVDWRTGGGHYGWAPMGPQVRVGVYMSIPSSHWIFVPQRYILSPRVHHYYVGHRNVVKIYNRTTIINNTYVYNNRRYSSGPSHRELERVTKNRVVVRDVHGSNRPGSTRVDQRTVSLYRPEVDQNTRSAARPTQVLDRNQVRGGNASTRSIAGTRSESGRTENAVTTRNTNATAPSRNNQAVRNEASTRSTSQSVQNGSDRNQNSRGAVATQSNNTSRERVDTNVPPVRNATGQQNGAANRASTTTRQKSGEAVRSTSTARENGAQAVRNTNTNRATTTAKQTENKDRAAARSTTQTTERARQEVRSTSQRSNSSQGSATRGNASRSTNERGSGSSRGN